ncbi:PREDICTED: KRAB-A domain-containing protein 2-like [Polistes canadensis]|uniref:KRAB-A domain-containing protein 2-like n=1 Tax=Polistes canadensis TaxID=91411 RepID=UPI000718CB8B|nr:PREDICTED: KRAB-A domain-containing protein 2-like [Polistes canadensis]
MEKQAVVLEKKSCLTGMKQRFNEELSKTRVITGRNSFFLTDTDNQKLINDVQKAKVIIKKEPEDFELLKRYYVVFVNEKIKLIYPSKEDSHVLQYYIADSELFNVLHETHINIGHEGSDRMMKELSSKYKNVTRKDIELYINLCECIQKKRKSIKKGIVVNPLISSEYNSRCQVDLIDFQSQPDREYKFIMVYQDHLTKFMIFGSLMSKKAEEVAKNLLDIFVMFGAPSILQSGNGREFANNIASSLKELWPALKIVHGKPRHSQNQGSVERANQDFEDMLCTWMQDNLSAFWH